MLIATNGKELQALLTKSGETGEPVMVQGILVVNESIKMNGGVLLGNLRSIFGNYNGSNSVIHFKGPASSLIMNPSEKNSPPSIDGLGLVFYHANTPTAGGLVFPSNCFGSTVRNCIIDRAGCGIIFEKGLPGRNLGHIFSNLRIISFRTNGIFCPHPINVSDLSFYELIYLDGRQGSDYDGQIPAKTNVIGINAIGNTWRVQDLLIEACDVALVVGPVINTTIGSLRIDDHLGLGIVFNAPYVDPERKYMPKFTVGHLYAGARNQKCILFSGDRRTFNSCSFAQIDKAICDKNGSWAPDLFMKQPR